jgi:quercetin dioxygenase-like cupin family protein
MKDREAIQNSLYERLVKYYQNWNERQKNGKLVVRFEDAEYQESRQGLVKFYLSPLINDTALNTWGVFEQLIRRQSGRHNHQGGIIIYVIEGEGATEINGEVLDWKAGDLLLLPIQPGGCSHQHWNKDASKGCRWIAFRDMLVAPYIANSIDQLSETPDLDGVSTTSILGSRNKNEWKTQVHGDQVDLITHPDQLNTVNMFDKLIELRNLQRTRLQQGTWLIRGEELPWELNEHGKMQWYLHPCIAYSSVQTNIFYKQEIPVGSRSGLQKHGGDIVFYILQGEGYTEVNGVKHHWKKNDVMTLPLFPEGVVYRHVNTGSEPIVFIGMERNFVHSVGVDRQSGFEEMQPCPEYRNQK